MGCRKAQSIMINYRFNHNSHEVGVKCCSLFQNPNGTGGSQKQVSSRCRRRHYPWEERTQRRSRALRTGADDPGGSGLIRGRLGGLPRQRSESVTPHLLLSSHSRTVSSKRISEACILFLLAVGNRFGFFPLTYSLMLVVASLDAGC